MPGLLGITGSLGTCYSPSWEHVELVGREMQIETTIRYRFTPHHTRMAVEASLKAHMVKNLPAMQETKASVPFRGHFGRRCSLY